MGSVHALEAPGKHMVPAAAKSAEGPWGGLKTATIHTEFAAMGCSLVEACRGARRLWGFPVQVRQVSLLHPWRCPWGKLRAGCRSRWMHRPFVSPE